MVYNTHFTYVTNSILTKNLKRIKTGVCSRFILYRDGSLFNGVGRVKILRGALLHLSVGALVFCTKN